MMAIDPGINGCGAAFYVDGALASAQYVKNSLDRRSDSSRRVLYMAMEVCARTVGTPDRLVVERPRVYLKSRTNPDNIMVLAEVGACVSGILGVPAETVRPSDWKGNISPEECTRRVRSRLTDEEFKAIELPKNSCAVCRMKDPGLKDCLKPHSCLAHNVYDAIGIGLFSLGRFGKWRNLDAV